VRPATQGAPAATATPYSVAAQAWVTGSLTITARTFVAPHPPPGSDGTFQSFTTTFTMCRHDHRVRDTRSHRHYLDLSSAVLGLTLVVVGYVLESRRKRHV
jgi:hypothetical protein